ncbi:type I pullulanase [Bacillus sp. 2205SS5-2]|uniref:type I pullulanase n=1 Tax=Bacillus sp. 2205SS5-2 TaxID=3109031 RepID=UPI0030067EFC
MKRSWIRKLSVVLIFTMILQLFYGIVPYANVSAEESVSFIVDGSKTDWQDVQPVATTKGWEGFDIENVYFSNDAEFLYYWVDTTNLPDWGDNGQFINIALNVNDEDSDVSGNPWGAQFSFSGTDKQPQFHIVARLSGTNGINGAAVYSSDNFEEPLVATWEDNKKGAGFSYDTTTGLEGKIPLSELGLVEADELKALVVLSGNNQDEHGVFDTIPSTQENEIASSWDQSGDNLNILSTYTNTYTISKETPEIVVDSQKEDWSTIAPLATDAGWQGFDIGEVYFQNDGQNLYFWVDGNFPDWGENGQFLDLALNINGEDSGVSEIPWKSQYNFSSAKEKPQYHITMRIKDDNEIAGAAVYTSQDFATPLATTWDAENGTEFAVDRTTGFEGKIPTSLLGLENGDSIRSIAVLSGNNKEEHGAFDVMPRSQENVVASSWNESTLPNTQGMYSNEYKLQGLVNLEQMEFTEASPVDGATNVKPTSSIQFSFSEGISLADTHGITFQTEDLDIDFTTEAVNQSVKITPDKPLALDTTYTVTLPKEVVTGTTTSTKNEKAQTITFTTAAAASPVINEDSSVTFNYIGDGSTSSVKVAGEFTSWETNALELIKGKDNIWSTTKAVPSGVYAYKLIVDGAWMLDPLNEAVLKGGYGEDSKLVVPGLGLTLPAEVQAGDQLDLKASFLNNEGKTVEVTPTWSLKEEVQGISVEGSSLNIANDVAADVTFTVMAKYQGYEVEKTITVLENLNTFTINYFRYDGEQNYWDMWMWDEGTEGAAYPFTSTTVDGFAQATYKFKNKKINVITRPGSWSDQEPTRMIEISEDENNVEAWVIQGVDEVFYRKEDADISQRIQSAMMDNENQIVAITTHPVADEDLATFKLYDVTADQEVATTATKVTDNKLVITLKGEASVNVRHEYEVGGTGFAAAAVTMREILNAPKHFYNGEDLGLTYSSPASTFKVWAPTATKVSLALYPNQGIYNEAGIVTDHSGGTEVAMTRSDQGVWAHTVDQNLSGQFYLYKVEFADGTTNYAVDPYAQAVSANGQRTAIINLESTDPKAWSEEKPPLLNPTDHILYELHVRDFSMDDNSGMTNKGKFKAFTETGTTTPGGAKSGVDHLSALGVTTVHLLPSYDFKTVDELTVDDPTSNKPKFNWGYDPQNYNVPEGSYSTDPNDPGVRITEFKEMVQALHDQGIRVVMDVVYNHTFEVPNGPFNKIVPGYFYRTTDTGNLANGSGVGNEIASERPMVRKYIKDSVRYWAEEYNVDGFRFDLMGLIDVNTMSQLTKELQEEVDSSILIYGEPWQAGGSPLAGNLQTLKGTQKDQGFAVFNDNFRGAIKGGSDDASKGFATGQPGTEANVVTGVKGAIDDFTNGPTETINYVTAHDNLNLWDKIIKTQGLEDEEGFLQILNGELQGEDAIAYSSVKQAVEEKTKSHHAIDPSNVLANETVQRSLLANGIVLTSQGIPFIHAGDELLRTKFGDHNSYKSPDSINQIRWEEKEAFKPVYDYYEGLMKLRQNHPAFRMTTKEAVAANLAVFKQEGNVVAFKLKNYANYDKWKNIVVIYNGNDASVDIPLSGEWNVVVDQKQAGIDVIRTVSDTVTVAPLSMMVLYDEANDYDSVVTSIEVNPPELGLEPEGVRTLSVVVKDQNGRPMIGEAINWSSSDEKVVKVVGGKVTAITSGNAIITAKIGQVEATVKVTVGKLVPTTISLTGETTLFTSRTTQLSASVKDQFAQSMPNAAIEWSSSNQDVASVDENGKVTGKTPGTVKITAKAGEITTSIEMKIEKYVQRYVQFTYEREDGDYTDWNIWTWQTGVKDGEVLFDNVTDKGAIATFEVGPETTSVGFVLRKGHDWSTATKDPIGTDRYITIQPSDSVTKVEITSGEEEFHTVPTVKGPILKDGDITFFYRDPKLYEENKMETIEKVQLQIDSETNEMVYNEANQYFEYTLKDVEEGTITYTFEVTVDGETTTVPDPYNTKDGKSTITYDRPDITLTPTVKPSAISYNENAVVTVKVDKPKDVNIQEMSIDLRAVDGPEKVYIDPSLNKQTIFVQDTVAAGTKKLPITALDEFGNEHKSVVSVEVKARQYVGDADFDWDEARIYFMLTDRFENGDTTNDDPNGENYDTTHSETYHGGDFQGVIDRLDYLEELGVNTVWITPVVDNIDWDLRWNKQGNQFGYHGYWAKDFTTLDEHLGDLNTFKELINSAHDRGIKIMVDVVLNHAGYGLKQDDPSNELAIPNYPSDENRARFMDMFRNGGTDVVQGELAGLPDFKTEEKAVRDQLIQWQVDWLEKARTDRGDTIDFFRVDTVKHVENTTWKALKNALTEQKPDFKMIGEHYGASVNQTGGYLESGQMDSLLDFEFKYKAQDFVNGNVEAVEEYLEYRNGQMNNTKMLGQFLSSHDEDGFLSSKVGGNVGKLKVAAALQITAKGQPVIYYGEELGQSGNHAGNMDAGEFNENRDDMPWEKVEGNDLLVHYQKLLNARKQLSSVLSKGNRTDVAGNNETGYMVFQREHQKEYVYVGLNTTNKKQTITLNLPKEMGDEVKDYYSGKMHKVVDGKVTLTFPKRDEGGTFIIGMKPRNIVERLAGTDRYQTAIEVSKQGWSSAETIVIARGDDFPDALAGAPLAYKYDAPILLTNQKRLNEDVQAEIKRLGAKKVIILGGKSAVSKFVEYQLRGLGLKIDRISGKDRFETAVNIAARLGGDPEKIVVANAYHFADALSVASYAAQNGYPIVLSAKDVLPASTAKAISHSEEVIVVGGKNAISEQIVKSFDQATRYSGADRYETSAEIAKNLTPKTGHAIIATGENFADALAGSVLAAKEKAEILLVKKVEVPKVINEAIEMDSVSNFYIVGGENAVSEAVSSALLKD